MTTSTTPDAQELAALRARAYGPRADLDADPAGLARLRELEAAARVAARATEPAVAAPPSSAEADAPDALEAALALESAPAGTAGPAEPATPAEVAVVPRVRQIPRAWIIAWAASIAAVALIVGGTVFALASIRPVSPQTGAVQVATLDEPVTDDEFLNSWFPATNDGVVYRFKGLTVGVSASGEFSGRAGEVAERCLFVGMPGGNDQQYSTGWSGCAAGSFPATVAFVVGPDAPRELREGYPPGTALQFVLDGDRVGVFRGSGPTQDAAED